MGIMLIITRGLHDGFTGSICTVLHMCFPQLNVHKVESRIDIHSKAREYKPAKLGTSKVGRQLDFVGKDREKCKNRESKFLSQLHLQ